MSMFRYALLEDVKAENVTSYSDDRINTFIEVASRFVNKVTDQFFVSVREIQYLDGHNGTEIYLNSRIPIQEIHSLKIDGNLISPQRYSVTGRSSEDRREIILKNPQGKEQLEFKEGNNNIEVDATLGWLEPRFDPALEVEVDQDANYSDEEIIVDDVSKIERHFIPTTEEETLPIVSDVDESTNKLSFDVPIRTDISSGDTLTFYGEIPSPIVRATVQLIAESIDPLSVESGQELTGAPSFQSRIVEEQTDNYRYRLESGIPEGVVERGDLTASVYTMLSQYTIDQFFQMSAV